MLELQRLNLEKGLPLPDAQQRALSESAALFLANQQEDQLLSEMIAKLDGEQAQLREARRAMEEKLQVQHTAARQRFDGEQRRHEMQLAGLKLLVLVSVLFTRHRGSLYAPLFNATGVAVLWRTILVMHDHFPAEYFKYIVLVAAIGLVVFVLRSLLRMMKFPKTSWLLKQYREAYAHFLCPVCEYPIHRGPLKFLVWTRRSIHRLKTPAPSPEDGNQPYACPVCGTRLFETCSACKSVRHALLPFCETCGAEKETADPAGKE